MPQSLIYMTAPSDDEALRIGRVLVEEHLAACVNILGPIRSLYHWQGAFHDDAEVAFLAKTADDRVAALIARVRALYPYELPCIVALPVQAGDGGFLDWITANSRPG
ncbi:divalent-cation tolerance protein CutA [Rhodospirillum rubrum]